MKCLLIYMVLICSIIYYIYNIAIYNISIVSQTYINPSYNSVYNNKNKVSIDFINFYESEMKKLELQIVKTKMCLKKYENDLSHAYRCNEYRTKLPHPSRIKYPDVYASYDGGYKAIIEPKKKINGYDILYAIPCSPALIDARIVKRLTIFNEEYIDGLRTKYLFFTGYVPDNFYKYNYSYLEEECIMFDDIVVFDMINTYNNITLLTLSILKWVINNYPNIKYYIRSDLDTLVYLNRIKGMLNKDYDVISEFTKYKNINYPQGCFYILSIKAVNLIYNKSFIHRPKNHFDDLYYGEIIGYDNTSLKIYNLRGEKIRMIWNCQFCEYIKSDAIIALHPYSPSSIFIMYNISKNK